VSKEPTTQDPITAVAALAEPTRRALYDLVAASPAAVGRDDAVTALGISRELAAFHLDRLVDVGLLTTEYRRRSGRTGPGAGRPAKFYRRSAGEVDLSIPPRRYDRAAELMASALQRLAGRSGIEALVRVARERGVRVGVDARRPAGRRTGRRPSLRGLIDVLDNAGYEPDVVTEGTVCLRNCPYKLLVEDHRDLLCGMNLAWAEGVVDGLGVQGVTVALAPEPGRCCVVFHSSPEADARRGGTAAPVEPRG
jgi:predicted ArsR family transcriptional regulator